METFFRENRGSVVNLMSRAIHDLDSAKVQTTVSIRFKVEVEDGVGMSLESIWLIRHSMVR